MIDPVMAIKNTAKKVAPKRIVNFKVDCTGTSIVFSRERDVDRWSSFCWPFSAADSGSEPAPEGCCFSRSCSDAMFTIGSSLCEAILLLFAVASHGCGHNHPHFYAMYRCSDCSVPGEARDDASTFARSLLVHGPAILDSGQ